MKRGALPPLVALTVLVATVPALGYLKLGTHIGSTTANLRWTNLPVRYYITDRGATGEELATLLESLGAGHVHVAADVAAACTAARAAAEPSDRVVVYGSFHTVGAALEALRLYCAPSLLVDRPAKWTRD